MFLFVVSGWRHSRRWSWPSVTKQKGLPPWSGWTSLELKNRSNWNDKKNIIYYNNESGTYNMYNESIDVIFRRGTRHVSCGEVLQRTLWYNSETAYFLPGQCHFTWTWHITDWVVHLVKLYIYLGGFLNILNIQIIVSINSKFPRGRWMDLLLFEETTLRCQYMFEDFSIWQTFSHWYSVIMYDYQLMFNCIPYIWNV